jgi:hypothetical protein
METARYGHETFLECRIQILRWIEERCERFWRWTWLKKWLSQGRRQSLSWSPASPLSQAGLAKAAGVTCLERMRNQRGWLVWMGWLAVAVPQGKSGKGTAVFCLPLPSFPTKTEFTSYRHVGILYSQRVQGKYKKVAACGSVDCLESPSVGHTIGNDRQNQGALEAGQSENHNKHRYSLFFFFSLFLFYPLSFFSPP